MSKPIDREALRQRLEAYAERYAQMSIESGRKAKRLHDLFPDDCQVQEEIRRHRREEDRLMSAAITIDSLLQEIDEW